MQHGGPTAARLGDDGECGGVERQRAQVLDDHQVRPAQRREDGSRIRWVGRRHRQAVDEVVGDPLAGHGADVEAELPEGVGPFRRLDRHAVGAPKAERDQGGDRHSGAL